VPLRRGSDAQKQKPILLARDRFLFLDSEALAPRQYKTHTSAVLCQRLSRFFATPLTRVACTA
jgi:hypothetical protein